jgi:hypothetical protein
MRFTLFQLLAIVTLLALAFALGVSGIRIQNENVGPCRKVGRQQAQLPTGSSSRYNEVGGVVKS